MLMSRGPSQKNYILLQHRYHKQKKTAKISPTYSGLVSGEILHKRAARSGASKTGRCPVKVRKTGYVGTNTREHTDVGGSGDISHL